MLSAAVTKHDDAIVHDNDNNDDHDHDNNIEGDDDNLDDVYHVESLKGKEYGNKKNDDKGTYTTTTYPSSDPWNNTETNSNEENDEEEEGNCGKIQPPVAF